MARAPISFALAAALLATRAARAQEAPRNLLIFQRSVPAASRALELGVGAGYNQGVGSRGISQDVQDIAGVGVGVDVGVGYRFSPRFGIGAYGTGALYSAVLPDWGVRSLAFGAQASWHFRPYRSLDPWISLGAGYRIFWESPPGLGTFTRKAFQAGRLSIGVDYRFSPEIAVGPYIAADFSVFFRETLPDGSSVSLDNAVSTFVAAGVAARFDLLGRAEHPAVDIASR